MNFADAHPPKEADPAPHHRRVLGIVPARLASTRLPNKPLYPLHGRPLLEWVWKRVQAMRVLDGAVVATDSEQIAEVCRALGAPVELTDPAHVSGTDRVAEVAERKPYRDFEVVVNIQGDEPLLREEHLAAAVELVRDGSWQVGTCATPLLTEEARKDPSVVKVARAADGRALYFSRASIPFRREGKPPAGELGGPPFLRHVGMYAYRREALLQWVARPPSPLERTEMLEQLRALEAGLSVGVALVSAAEGGVDTPADVVRVEARLLDLGLVEAVDLEPKAT